MIVQLKRASNCGRKPDKIAYPLTEESAEFFEDNWYDEWLADIPSLEWAFDKWGPIVVSKSDIKYVKYDITIYDDYVE
jgi:hypothetical protein